MQSGRNILSVPRTLHYLVYKVYFVFIGLFSHEWKDTVNPFKELSRLNKV